MTPAPQPILAGPPDDAASDEQRTEPLVAMLRLHWFIRLRWVFVIAVVALGTFEKLVWPETQRPMGLMFMLFLLLAVNLGWSGVSRALALRVVQGEADDRHLIHRALFFANAQVATDLLMLTGFVYFTGGIENPLALFYLFHMTISSLLLRPRHAVAQGLWAVVLYSTMAILVWGGWLPHHPFLPALEAQRVHESTEFVAASVAALTCGVFGTLYFTLHIVARLEKRSIQLRETNEALARAQVTTRDLERRRSRFMQTAAHQLKSPLAGIQTLVSLIRDGIVPAESIPEMCDKIAQRCRDGIAQVTELLTLARVQEADPRRNHDTRTNVGTTVYSLYHQFKPVAADQQITLTCHVVENADLEAFVDPADLRDCLGNLIENALKYTPEGGTVRLSVTRSARALSQPVTYRGGEASGEQRVIDCIEVQVEDTGMGIDEGALLGEEGVAGAGSIFDAFRRGNGALSASIPGTGLGLSIVREVVEHAGGQIRVRSELGQGSTFIVCFPAENRGTAQSVRYTRASQMLGQSGDHEAQTGR
jgi:signal transduction histidine kinase